VITVAVVCAEAAALESEILFGGTRRRGDTKGKERGEGGRGAASFFGGVVWVLGMGMITFPVVWTGADAHR
jgi:hypothetical protein